MLLAAWRACACLVSLLIPVAFSGVEVRGPTACPTADEVSARITPLLTAEAALPPSDRIELRDVVSPGNGTGELEIHLIREGTAQPLGVRRVRRESSCSDTADAVAVVAATWIASYSTKPASAPPLPVPTAIGTAASVDRAGGRRSSPWGTGNTDRAWGLGVAAGVLGGSAGGTSATFQAEVEKRMSAHWVMRLAGAGAGQRSLPFNGGEARWQRFLLLPTVGYAWRIGPVRAEVGAGPVGALLRAQGRGFAVSDSDMAIDGGGAATIRIGGRLGRLPVLLWSSGTGLLWMRTQRAVLDGTTTSLPLPRSDVTFTAGLTFFFAS